MLCSILSAQGGLDGCGSRTIPGHRAGRPCWVEPDANPTHFPIARESTVDTLGELECCSGRRRVQLSQYCWKRDLVAPEENIDGERRRRPSDIEGNPR
jgi:hypothetical protein